MPKEGKCTCATDVHVRYVRAPSYPDASFGISSKRKEPKAQKKNPPKKKEKKIEK
jgi:hypothetical protein